MGGKATYDFDDKNRWRRWWVNQFADRLGGNRMSLRDKNVLYLCAEDGGEADLLVERGFSRENLYACDIDAENARKHRERGGNAITGDFHTAVRVWPDDIKLHGVAADLCSPFNASSADLAIALLNCDAMQSGGVVGVNLLRGRDAASEETREYLVKSAGLKQSCNDWVEQTGLRTDDAWKHRGLFWFLNFLHIAAGCTDRGVVDVGQSYLMHSLYAIGGPKFYSYQSGSLRMDSVVFSWLAPCGEKLPIDEWVNDRSSRSIHGKRIKVTRPKIAAMRAVLRKQVTKRTAIA